jgi:cell division GTPase FtsZ
VKNGRSSPPKEHITSLLKTSHQRAKGVLMNITSGTDLTMEEMTQSLERIYHEVGVDADTSGGVVDEY